MIRFGICLGASLREPIRRVVRLVSEAEQLGFTTAYILDSQLVVKDAFVTMSLCAEATSRIRLATGVTNPITRDITVVASAFAALQEISDGRAVLGIGNGGSAPESIGLKGANLARTEQSIRQLAALLAGEQLEYNGRTVVMPRTSPPVPIYLSASQPKMLDLAGRLANGVVLMGSSQPELIAKQIATVLQGVTASGRSRPDFTIDLWQTISVSDDRGRALDDVRSWVASQQQFWFARTRQLPTELRRLVSDDQLEAVTRDYDLAQHMSVSAEHTHYVSDELADFMAIAGPRDHCIARLKSLAVLDVDSITVTLLSGGRERRLADLASVMREV